MHCGNLATSLIWLPNVSSTSSLPLPHCTSKCLQTLPKEAQGHDHSWLRTTDTEGRASQTAGALPGESWPASSGGVAVGDRTAQDFKGMDGCWRARRDSSPSSLQTSLEFKILRETGGTVGKHDEAKPRRRAWAGNRPCKGQSKLRVAGGAGNSRRALHSPSL